MRNAKFRFLANYPPRQFRQKLRAVVAAGAPRRAAYSMHAQAPFSVPRTRPSLYRASARPRTIPVPRACYTATALCTTVLLLTALLRQPRATKVTNALHPSFGHEAGTACHEIPRDPPESRPCGCASRMAAQEQAAAKAGWRAAILVITHNEAGCVLRRTLLAVLARTPHALLQQVLVLDDASDPPAQAAVVAAGGLEPAGGPMDTSGGPMGISTAARLVHWRRSADRIGVMRARAAAVAATSAPVLVFLDAHCEPQRGWLPPLLAHLDAHERAVALPVIESIDPASFEYTPLTPAAAPPRGVFDWNLTFHWRHRAPATAQGGAPGAAPRNGPSAGPGAAVGAAADGAPVPCDGATALPSPAMAGGIFAVRRTWYEEAADP